MRTGPSANNFKQFNYNDYIIVKLFKTENVLLCSGCAGGRGPGIFRQVMMVLPGTPTVAAGAATGV